MPERHSMLVVIDPTTDAQPALSKATMLAEQIGADVALLACIHDSYTPSERFISGADLLQARSDAMDKQLGTLQQFAEPARGTGLSVSCKVVWDFPLHEAIVREALHIEPDFVVKDTHHHSALSRVLFTNTDWHLIRECPSTLWLVKPSPAPARATVMAAIDPTHEHDEPAALDRRIIAQAQLLSVMFEERLHLVHVFNPPLPGLGGAFVSPAPSVWPVDADLVDEIEQYHAGALDRLAADIGFPPDQVHLRQGNPVSVLPECARELNANIVVMGAVARSRLERAFIGSTAEKTLEHFPCDVVIVKADGFVSPVKSSDRAPDFMEKTA